MEDHDSSAGAGPDREVDRAETTTDERRGKRSDGSSVLASRRTYLKGVALAGLTSVVATPASAHHELRSEYRTVVDVVDEGADPEGNESITPVLEDLRGDDTLVEFPDGRYYMDETFRFTKFRNFGLVGTNGATIVPPNYWNRKDDDVWLFRLGTESRPGRDLRVQNLTVDQTAPDTGMRVVNGVVTDGLEVRDIDIQGRHDSGLPGPGLFAVRDPDGEGVVERFRHPAGADFRENTPTGDSGWWFEPTGIYANGNRGTLRFKDCALGGFPDTGLYASWGSGKIVVEGGTYVNSETACLRIGGTGSVVTDATVGVDDVNYENDSQRGIRLENASDVRVAETSVEITDPNGSAILVRSNTDGTVIEDCTVSVSTDRSATGIRVSGRAGETSVLRTDVEFDAAGGYALWMADGGRSDHDTVECTYVSITGDAATDGGRFAIINGRDNTEFRATEVRQSSRDRFRTALRNTGDDVLIYRGRYVSRNNPIIDFGSGTWVESTYAKARSGEPSYLLQADSEDVLIKKSTIVNGIDDRGCDGLRTWANDFDG